MRVYEVLETDHPIDLTRYRVAKCYMGRAGPINSVGASVENDFAEAIKTALNTIQDVYLCKEVTIA